MFCFSPWDCSNSSLQLGQPWELGREEIGCLSAFCLKDGWTGWIFLFMFAKFLIWSQRSPLPESLPALHLHSVLRVQIWPQKQQWLKDGRGCSEFTDLRITQWWLETCDVLALQSRNTRFYLKIWILRWSFQAFPFYIYDAVASCFSASFELYRELSKCRCFSFINV